MSHIGEMYLKSDEFSRFPPFLRLVLFQRQPLVMWRLNFFISLRRDSNSVLASTVCQRLEKESRFLVIIDDTGVFNTRLSPKSPSCRNTKENSLQSLRKFRSFWNYSSHTLYSVKQIKFHWHITHYFLDLLSWLTTIVNMDRHHLYLWSIFYIVKQILHFCTFRVFCQPPVHEVFILIEQSNKKPNCLTYRPSWSR